MRPEITAIPPAPRRVRWQSVIFRRWPFGLLGILLAGYGSLLTWMFWLSANNSHVAVAERKLDAGCARTEGVVTAVGLEASGRERVHYRFTLTDGSSQDGESLFAVDDAHHAVGAPLLVDYLARESVVSRAVGGHVAFILDAHRVVLASLVVPGLLALLIWFGSVLAARALLSHGDLAVAEDLSVREVRYLIPTMLDVRFRFRDRQAQLCDGRHVVAARSRLGHLVVTQRAGVGVIHDRTRPSRHQLVVPEDFVAITAGRTS